MFGELEVAARDPTYVVSGKPNTLFLCFGSSSESRGQGSSDRRRLHPEALSSYQYFQSSWPKQVVYQMDCGREVSCPDPATHMLYVQEQVIYTYLLWTVDTCYMGSLNIILVINIESLFTFHCKFGSFPTTIGSFQMVSLPAYLGPEVYFSVK